MSLRSETKNPFYLSELVWALKSGNEPTSQDLRARAVSNLCIQHCCHWSQLKMRDLGNHDLPTLQCKGLPWKFAFARHPGHGTKSVEIQGACKAEAEEQVPPSVAGVWCGEQGSTEPRVLQKATNARGRWWSINSKVRLFFPPKLTTFWDG